MAEEVFVLGDIILLDDRGDQDSRVLFSIRIHGPYPSCILVGRNGLSSTYFNVSHFLGDFSFLVFESIFEFFFGKLPQHYPDHFSRVEIGVLLNQDDDLVCIRSYEKN